MRQDRDGRVFFVDRLGDTFRWKSENVSTSEVSDVIGDFHQITEANVYGVQIPNADGRCGCAAIVLKEGVTETSFDFASLASYATSTLPRYAVPIFLRLTPALQYTGTLKMQKGALRQQGIDLKLIGADRLYWLQSDGKSYKQFTAQDFEDLKAGRARL